MRMRIRSATHGLLCVARRSELLAKPLHLGFRSAQAGLHVDAVVRKDDARRKIGGFTTAHAVGCFLHFALRRAGVAPRALGVGRSLVSSLW